MLAVVLGLAVPSLVAYFIEQRLTEHSVRTEVRRDLHNASEMLALSLQPSVWDFSQQNATAIAKAVFKDERYVSIIVTSSKNDSFVRLERTGNSVAEKAELISEARDIRVEGKVIGRLVIAMSTAHYLEEGKRALLWNALRVSVMLICSIVLILFVLQRRIFKPLRQLTLATQRITDKQFTIPIELPQTDEFGDVGSAMEQMRRTLLTSFEALGEKNRELADHAEHLEQHVNERTIALSHANQELQRTLQQLQTTQDILVQSEKLASLGRLVAGVSHELNTPIGNAMTAASTLEDHSQSLMAAIDAGTLTRSTMREMLSLAREGQGLVCRNLARAVDIIQHFKQLSIDQTSEMRREFDLAVVLEEVLITLRPHFKHANLHLEAMETPSICMNSFPGPLGQVITNLVLNAVLHAFPDQKSTGLVQISVGEPDPEHVLLCVKDNGTGMTEDVRKHAFDPFFTTKFGQGGSGLGLHIVRNIVTGVLGGQIELFSEPGHGSEFRILCPLRAPNKTVANGSL